MYQLKIVKNFVGRKFIPTVRLLLFDYQKILVANLIMRAIIIMRVPSRFNILDWRWSFLRKHNVKHFRPDQVDIK